MRRYPLIKAVAAASVVAVTLLVAACGSTSQTKTAGTAKVAATGTNTAASTSLDQAAVQFQSFVGGTAGSADASKSPVVFGFINDQGGVPSFPEGSLAADAAVKLVNDKLGGIHGHPLQLSVCLVATGEAQGQSCAQQFRNNPAVVAVVEDSAVVGAQAFHNTLAGVIPTIIGSPNSTADATAKNSYPISAGVFGTSPGFVGYASHYLHAKTASLLYPADDPTGQLAAKQIKQGLEQAGIKVTVAGYQSNAPSLLGPVTASGAGHTDVVVTLFPSPPTCIAGAKALQTVVGSEPVLALGQCLAQPVKSALGDYPKWTYVSTAENPFLPKSAPDIAAYDTVMSAYAPGVNLGGFAPEAFAAVLTGAKAANAASGAVTPASIAAFMKHFTGPAPLHAPGLKAGIIPGLPTLNSIATRLYTYLGNGAWKDATNGTWVGG